MLPNGSVVAEKVYSVIYFPCLMWQDMAILVLGFQRGRVSIITLNTCFAIGTVWQVNQQSSDLKKNSTGTD